MSVTKISELLPIPENVSQPHAYQIFGLEGGEQDDAKVAEAMREVYAKLKASKSNCDPTVWTQAAKIAETARKILEDPDRRRELDARFGVVPAVDPLSDLLPKADPTTAAAVLGMPPLGSPPPEAAAPTVLGTPPVGTAHVGTAPSVVPTGQPHSQTQPQLGNIATGTGPVSPDGSALGNWQPAKPKKKRRKSKTGVFVLGAFVLLMLGAIGGLLHFFNQQGPVVINGSSDNDGRIVAPSRDVVPTKTVDDPPKDPVLDNVASSGIAKGPGQSSGLASANPMDANLIKVDPMPVTSKPDPLEPDTATPEETKTMEAAVPVESTEPAAITDQMLAFNDQAIGSVEQLIRDANWLGMKPAAEALEKRTLSAAQAKRATALFDIADLASYYRGAIERGMASLTATSELDLGNDVRAIIVESSESDLTILFDRKQLSYTIDTLPPRLMELIATKALPGDQPDALAGLALYRLIDPKTNAEYRALAFEQLDSVDGQLEAVDSTQLRRVARELFGQ